MAHKKEFISTGGGFSVKNGSTVTNVIAQDGTLSAECVLADNSVITKLIKDKNVTTGKLADKAVTNAKLADDAVDTVNILDKAITADKLDVGILASHVVKFLVKGNTITGTALVGVDVGDVVVTILGDGVVTVGLVATEDTLPTDPGDDDYLVVFRAVA